MANEKRLIDANELGRFSFHIMCEGEDGEAFERCVVDWDDIETAPTVDAVEVVHGRWIEKEDVVESYLEDCTEVFYECSVCISPNGDETNYCPNCGAKMDGGTSP